MGIDERLKNIEEYVIQFNAEVKESAYYLFLQFPQNWTVPSVPALKENYKVECLKGDTPGTIIIGAEMNDGYDCVFDAAEFIISFNKDVEERVVLLNKYIGELKQLFGTLKLEQLRTLQFKFDGDNIVNMAEIAAAKQSSAETVKEEKPQTETKKKRGQKKSTAEKNETTAEENKEGESLLDFVETTLN